MYSFWFAEKTKFAGEHHLVIGVPNLFLQERLEQKFVWYVRAVVQELMGAAARARF